jgi:hypothetical protein
MSDSDLEIKTEEKTQEPVFPVNKKVDNRSKPRTEAQKAAFTRACEKRKENASKRIEERKIKKMDMKEAAIKVKPELKNEDYSESEEEKVVFVKKSAKKTKTKRVVYVKQESESESESESDFENEEIEIPKSKKRRSQNVNVVVNTHKNDEPARKQRHPVSDNMFV